MANAYFPIFTRFAEDDLLETLEYSIDRNPEYIPKLVEPIDIRLEELTHYPEGGRIVPELEKKSITDYRELIEGNHRMIYHIKDQDVLLFAIIDGRRNRTTTASTGLRLRREKIH